MEEPRSRSVACASLSKFKMVARAGVVGWWRRRTADPAMRVPLRRTGAVSCGVVIGSLVLARVIAATGSRLLLALVFIVFVGAVFTLFAVVMAWCEACVDEIDPADPVRVRNRGTIAGTMRRLWGNVAAGAQRASRVWLSSAASIVTGLASRFARLVAVVRRAVTSDTVRQWLRVTTDALSGIPPPDVSAPAEACEGERASTPVGAVYGDAQSGLASPDSPDLRVGHTVKDRVV
jgi:hypothetical protein